MNICDGKFPRSPRSPTLAVLIQKIRFRDLQSSLVVRCLPSQLSPAAPRSGDLKFESGYEIQPQRRKAKGLLISLVQEVIEAPIDFDALGQLVGEASVQQFISVISEQAGKPQFASKSSIIRLDIEHRAANRPIHVEQQPLLRPSRVESSGVARTAKQRFSDGERINGFRKAVQRQDRGIQPSVRA